MWHSQKWQRNLVWWRVRQSSCCHGSFSEGDIPWWSRLA